MAGGTQGGGIKRSGARGTRPGARRYARVEQASLDVYFGARRLFWIEYDAGLVTLSGAQVTAVANKFSGLTGDFEPYNAGIRPTREASSGPNSTPIITGSAYDQITDLTTSWLAAGESFAVYAVLRMDDAGSGYSLPLKIGPLELWYYEPLARFEAWHADDYADSANSALGTVGEWYAVRMYVDAAGAFALGVNNEEYVTQSFTGTNPAVLGVGISGYIILPGPTAVGSADSHAMVLAVSGLPTDADDARMAAYIAQRFGTDDVPALTWGGGASNATPTHPGTQGAHVKRWAQAFPLDGLPLGGIVDDVSGELIVDSGTGELIVNA